MKIPGNCLDFLTLEAFGIQARQLLCSSNISELGNKFGYALACGRDPAEAILTAVNASLRELGALHIVEFAPHPEPVVKCFLPNEIGLVALVECRVLTDNDSLVLLELVVTGNDENRYISVEQICGVFKLRD